VDRFVSSWCLSLLRPCKLSEFPPPAQSRSCCNCRVWSQQEAPVHWEGGRSQAQLPASILAFEEPRTLLGALCATLWGEKGQPHAACTPQTVRPLQKGSHLLLCSLHCLVTVLNQLTRRNLRWKRPLKPPSLSPSWSYGFAVSVVAVGLQLASAVHNKPLPSKTACLSLPVCPHAALWEKPSSLPITYWFKASLGFLSLLLSGFPYFLLRSLQRWDAETHGL